MSLSPSDRRLLARLRDMYSDLGGLTTALRENIGELTAADLNDRDPDFEYVEKRVGRIEKILVRVASDAHVQLRKRGDL